MIKPRRFSLRARLGVGFAAGVAALATAAILVSAGSAQTMPSTLHMIAKSQNNVGFFPKHRPQQGDRFGFGDKLSGDDSGFDRGVCTVIGNARVQNPHAANELCVVQAQLSKGTLSLQGMIPQQSHNTPIAVTGGTGAYNGARGTAVVTNVDSTRSDVQVTLLP